MRTLFEIFAMNETQSTCIQNIFIFDISIINQVEAGNQRFRLHSYIFSLRTIISVKPRPLSVSHMHQTTQNIWHDDEKQCYIYIRFSSM